MNNDFTLTLGAGSNIECHGRRHEHDFRITLVDTGGETMTGGRVRRIEPFIDADTFMVTYGDGLSDIDVRRLLEFHRSHGKLATVTAVHLETTAKVPGVSAGKFAELAAGAKAGCPISRLLKAEITLDAKLV